MKKYIFCSLFLILIIVFSSSLYVFSADYIPNTSPIQFEKLGVGNQNSYSSNSRSGSSGYSSYNSRSSSSYSSDGSSSLYSLFIWIVVLVIISLVVKKGKKSANNTEIQPVQPTPVIPPKPTISQTMKLLKSDPHFSESTFLAWTREVFMTLNTAWTKRDWSLIRPFETDSLFREHNQQLDEYIRNGTINHIERIAIKDCYIERYYTDKSYEYLVVKMRTSMIDYVEEIATGRITAGDKTTVWQMMHTLTFTRKIGVKTKHGVDLHTTNCPNCGAPADISAQGQCAYCGSPVTTGENNWVLCKFEGQNL